MNNDFKLIKDEITSIIKTKKVLIACSTGVDSMVLLTILEECLKNDQIVIAHINHQKRLQANEEENYIKEYANKKNIKCYVTKLEHYNGNNFQAWARKKRYDFFYDCAKKENIKMILLAHHANDNIETILERFLRSSSLEGYGGIRKITKYQDLTLYRPLINISKKDIEIYAKTKKIKYYDDETNFSDDYMRNRIRHHIIPYLEQENPSLIKAIKNYSQTIFEASDFIENYETNFIKKQITVYNNNEQKIIKLKIDNLLKETTFLQVQILFRILKPYKLSKNCILDLIKQIKSSKNKIVLNVNTKLLMIKEYGYLIFTTPLKKENFYLKITNDGIYNLPNNTKIEVNKNICNFITSNGNLWYNINRLPLIIRTRKSGDKIKTKAGTVLVSDYLTNHKVPYLEREKILLLCDNDNNPVTILGYQIN